MHATFTGHSSARPKPETATHASIQTHCLSAQLADEDPFVDERDHRLGAMSPLMQFVLSRDVTSRPASVCWPVTWIFGGRSAERISATQIIAVSGADVRTVEQDGRVIGGAYADEDAEYFYLGGVLPQDVHQPRARQARSVFERLEAALTQVGMDFSNVVRTWLYLDRLLEWYDEFNAVRTTFFRERGVFNHLVPASTGIGAENPSGAALVAGAIAVKPRTGRVRSFAVQSPLQCPAIDYRSSFSRAVEVAGPGGRQLYISGTASIAADGRSAHVGDPVAQIDLTMNVVHAILRSRRMDWTDTTRMIAYFRNAADIPHFNAWCTRAGLRNPPVVFMLATVCRDELLFELELDAAAAPS